LSTLSSLVAAVVVAEGINTLLAHQRKSSIYLAVAAGQADIELRQGLLLPLVLQSP
jgi:hypothetical protein